MKNIRKEKGITLITLVITIIVLLILAGVAISSITGENGILARATDAKDKTETARQDEETKLKGYEDYINEINGNKTDNSSGGGATDNPSDEGAVVSISSITEENYGDEIKGYSVLEGDYKVDSWKIFLKDDDGVWIMASDYVQLDSVTANAAGMTASGYNAYWSSAPSNGETYDNGNCAKSLSNTANWTKYVDTKLATKAMGGATIEMFAKSYNAKYSSGTNGIIDFTNKDTDYNGYKVRWKKTGEESYSYYISGLENDGFYYLSDTKSDSIYAYWLASPSARDSNDVVYVNCNGNVTTNYFINSYNGVRPVVCLKSDIQVKSTTSGDVTTWTIQ